MRTLENPLVSGPLSRNFASKGEARVRDNGNELVWKYCVASAGGGGRHFCRRHCANFAGYFDLSFAGARGGVESFDFALWGGGWWNADSDEDESGAERDG